MKTGYSKQIQERINGADDGTIFVNSDFADIADSGNNQAQSEQINANRYASPDIKGCLRKSRSTASCLMNT